MLPSKDVDFMFVLLFRVKMTRGTKSYSLPSSLWAEKGEENCCEFIARIYMYVEYSVGGMTESIGNGALGRLGHFIT